MFKYRKIKFITVTLGLVLIAKIYFLTRTTFSDNRVINSTDSRVTFEVEPATFIKQKSKFAIVSMLTTNKEYIPALQLLGHSVRTHLTRKDVDYLVILNENSTLSKLEVMGIEAGGWTPLKVKAIPISASNQKYADYFIKLNLWRLTDYEGIIFLDADTLVLRSLESVFNLLLDAKNISLVAASKWPGDPEFNPGFLALKPNVTIFEQLVQLLNTPNIHKMLNVPEHLFRDYLLLNHFYKDRWHRLGLGYNLLVKLYEQKPELWGETWPNATVVHYQREDSKPFLISGEPWDQPSGPTLVWLKKEAEMLSKSSAKYTLVYILNSCETLTKPHLKQLMELSPVKHFALVIITSPENLECFQQLSALYPSSHAVAVSSSEIEHCATSQKQPKDDYLCLLNSLKIVAETNPFLSIYFFSLILTSNVQQVLEIDGIVGSGDQTLDRLFVIKSLSAIGGTRLAIKILASKFSQCKKQDNSLDKLLVVLQDHQILENVNDLVQSATMHQVLRNRAVSC